MVKNLLPYLHISPLSLHLPLLGPLHDASRQICFSLREAYFLFASTEWPFHSGRNEMIHFIQAGMEWVISFWPEWNGPFHSSWNGMTFFSFQPEWIGPFHSSWREVTIPLHPRLFQRGPKSLTSNGGPLVFILFFFFWFLTLQFCREGGFTPLPKVFNRIIFHFPVSEGHNRVDNRIAKVAKIIG